MDYWTNELYHHGIKGQRWGVRRYQNDDGSLTSAGRARYLIGDGQSAKSIQKSLNRADQEAAYAIGRINKNSKLESKLRNKAQKIVGKATSKDGDINLSDRQKKKLGKLTDKAQNAIKAEEIARMDLKKIESDQWKLMGKAAEQGYSVLTTPKYRQTVTTGRQMADYLLFGAIGAGIKEASEYGSGGTVTKGNKFKVRG